MKTVVTGAAGFIGAKSGESTVQGRKGSAHC